MRLSILVLSQSCRAGSTMRVLCRAANGYRRPSVDEGTWWRRVVRPDSQDRSRDRDRWGERASSCVCTATRTARYPGLSTALSRNAAGRTDPGDRRLEAAGEAVTAADPGYGSPQSRRRAPRAGRMKAGDCRRLSETQISPARGASSRLPGSVDRPRASQVDRRAAGRKRLLAAGADMINHWGNSQTTMHIPIFVINLDRRPDRMRYAPCPASEPTNTAAIFRPRARASPRSAPRDP